MRGRRSVPLHRVLSRRIRTGRSRGYKVAGAAAGLSATAIGLINATGFTFAFWEVGAALGLAVVTGVVTAVVTGSESLIPRAICDRATTDGKYSAMCCTDAQLRQANEWTGPHYGSEFVGSDIVMQWHLRNPRGFVAILNQQNELCASFGMIALRPGVVDTHMRGNVLDSELSGSDILSFRETKLSDHVYISGVIVNQPGCQAGSRRADVMIWCMLKYVRRFLGLRRARTLYAIAVTPDAKRLLQNLGFSLHTVGRLRRDRCDLFTLALTTESWEQMLGRVGDLSPMCTLRFAKEARDGR